MAKRTRPRLSAAERGLGTPHRTDRKRKMAALIDGTRCPRCGRPMYRWQHLDLDHVTPRMLGGAGGQTVLTHRHCNRSAGATLGNRMRGNVRAWPAAREW